MYPKWGSAKHEEACFFMLNPAKGTLSLWNPIIKNKRVLTQQSAPFFAAGRAVG